MPLWKNNNFLCSKFIKNLNIGCYRILCNMLNMLHKIMVRTHNQQKDIAKNNIPAFHSRGVVKPLNNFATSNSRFEVQAIIEYVDGDMT